jgi:hypothetical protein
MDKDRDVPKYNDIQAHPPERSAAGDVVRQSTSMTYDQGNQRNSRASGEGARADSRVRRGTFESTGRDAGHRHGLSGNAPPDNHANVFPANSIQNRQGGTKALLEQQRDRIIREQAGVAIREESTLVFQPGRKNFGDRVPIAEVVGHSVYSAGRPTGVHREVIFGNFESSASRHSDAQRAVGKKADSAELRRLVRLDRERLRAQGNASAAAANERSRGLRTSPPTGGMPRPPRLVVDNRSFEELPGPTDERLSPSSPSRGRPTKPPRGPSR